MYVFWKYNHKDQACKKISILIETIFTTYFEFLLLILPLELPKIFKIYFNDLYFSSKISTINLILICIDKGIGGLSKIKNSIFGQNNELGTKQSIQYPTDVYANTNITLCYYLGDDIEKSHLQHNDQWKYDAYNLDGLYNYINQLTLGTNILLGTYLNNTSIYLQGVLFLI